MRININKTMLLLDELLYYRMWLKFLSKISDALKRYFNTTVNTHFLFSII